MKTNYLIAFFILLVFAGKAQQDPQYNLYQFNQMVINPAYAGARDAIAVIASARQQWSGFDGAPRTSCFSAHGPILNKNVGVGLTVIQDAMGPRKMFGAYGNFAYILRLGQKYKLAMGLSAGYNRFQFDYSKLTYKTTEINPEIYNNQTRGVLDLNFGTYLRSSTFFMGLSVSHLNRATVLDFRVPNNNEILYRLRSHLFFTIGKSIQLNENLIFAPTLMLRMAGQKPSADINFNFFILKKLWLGAFIKSAYGPGFLMQYNVTNKMRVGYSFDSGMNDARRLGAAHEIIIGFDFADNKNKILSPRFL
jgi:type IX secretion system PorP/SprF family membrane protein